MREPYFPKQLNLHLENPYNWSMLTFVGQSHHQQSMKRSIFLLIVDDFSRLMWVKILKNKSEVFSAF